MKKLYIILKIEIPLPYQQAILPHPFPLREGGERAPVALCREPTEPAGETGVGRMTQRQRRSVANRPNRKARRERPFRNLGPKIG